MKTLDFIALVCVFIRHSHLSEIKEKNSIHS